MLPYASAMLLTGAAAGGGGGSAPYGTHAYWELEIDTVNGGPAVRLSGLTFYDGSGTVIPASGGTAFSGGSGSDAASVSNLFDGNSSTVWERSSATNTQAGYQFAVPVGVAKIDMSISGNSDEAPLTCRLRHSDDGATYTTAFEIWEPSWPASGAATRTWPQDFTAAFKAFRFYITGTTSSGTEIMNEAEIHATVGGSDICNGGATNQSVANVNATADRLWDNDLSTFFGFTTAQLPGWGSYAFPTPQAKPAEYVFTQNFDPTYAWTAWKLQGSKDGTTWTDLDTQSGITWSTTPETKTFAVP